MKQTLKNIFYSFPVQFFILHFIKFQLLLMFWYLLESAINSRFMKHYGPDAPLLFSGISQRSECSKCIYS